MTNVSPGLWLLPSLARCVPVCAGACSREMLVFSVGSGDGTVGTWVSPWALEGVVGALGWVQKGAGWEQEDLEESRWWQWDFGESKQMGARKSWWFLQ